MLSQLDPAEIAARLQVLAGEGNVPVMVCYEHLPDIEAGRTWCHRHLVAKWLEDHLFITVPELGHEERRIDRFALLKMHGIARPTYKAYEPQLRLL